jgi:hypothetical protein
VDLGISLEAVAAIVDHARVLTVERSEGRDTADYRLAMDNPGVLLAEGVAAFGFSIAEIER